MGKKAFEPVRGPQHQSSSRIKTRQHTHAATDDQHTRAATDDQEALAKVKTQPAKAEDGDEQDDDESYGWGHFITFVLAVAAYITLQLWRSQELPKLSSFGVRDWAVECQGDGRHYRLKSSNPYDANTGHDFTNRDLSFLDAQHNTLYYTGYFDTKSLDQKNVWRFKKHKDTRLMGTKNEAAVLTGDEAWFEISENLDQLHIVKADTSRITLPCRKLAL